MSHGVPMLKLVQIEIKSLRGKAVCNIESPSFMISTAKLTNGGAFRWVFGRTSDLQFPASGSPISSMPIILDGVKICSGAHLADSVCSWMITVVEPSKGELAGYICCSIRSINPAGTSAPLKQGISKLIREVCCIAKRGTSASVLD